MSNCLYTTVTTFKLFPNIYKLYWNFRRWSIHYIEAIWSSVLVVRQLYKPSYTRTTLFLGTPLLVLSKSRVQILKACHSDLTAGHLGKTRSTCGNYYVTVVIIIISCWILPSKILFIEILCVLDSLLYCRLSARRSTSKQVVPDTLLQNKLSPDTLLQIK